MQLCSIMSRDPKTTIKTIVAIFSLLVIVLILPRPVAALQTALVRASDGDVYQIRFRNRALDSGYDVGDFIDDFSIYNEAGTVELCPGNDEAVTWELYSVARVLAKTRSSTPVFSRDTLHETLIQAIEDQDLTPVLIAEKLLVREVVGNITSGIQSHTFLKGLSIVPKSGPAAIIVVPAVLISKLGNIEIRIRKLLYAFWIASTHADTAIVLQKLANQKAAALWNAINAGKIIDTFGGGFSVDTRSGEISGDIGVDGPLRLRLIAEVYQDNAERAAELGADLGKSEDAWFNWLEGLTGVGDILQLLTSLVDVPLLKGALEDLEASSGEKLRAKIKGEIENIYDSAAFSLRWHGFCTPGLRLNSAGFDVYEGHDLIYTVALDAPPEGVATIAVSSSNPDATVSPTMLTFTANDWYKPKPVRMVTVEDADIVNERVSLTHTATGYGEILPHGISFLIIDRKGNEAPELVDTIGPLSLSLDDEFRLDIADYFRDPEGSELRYSHSIVGQNFDVLRVKRDAVGSWITIRPQKIGSTTVNIWARDPEGLEAGYTFMVTVTAEENRAPVAVGTIPAQTLAVGDSSPSLDLSTYFRDPNNDILTYTTEQSNPDVALPQITGSQLTIWTLSTGSTTVTVKATNSADLFTIQTFTVTVTDAQNRAPVAVGTIPTQSLTIGSASPPLEVSVYFRDPNDDPLTYMAASSNPTVATAQRTGSQLTIWPRGIGTATITITAANLDGTFATQTFIVTVTDDEVPTERPTPQGLSVGDAVIVQNTGSDGLNVRSDPQVSNQNRDNKIGFLQDGATGTITDGPRQANNFIWWQIEWESSNKVHWTHQPTNKRGWSVEAIGEVGLLAIRPSEPITQSFDLAIQSFTISKNTLDPDESFTLSVTIHNNGPGDSPGPALSYYHSSIHGFAVTDPPQLQGTVQLDPLASGERITKSIPLEAPSTPKTYYYGAWLSANTGDTNLNNDFATEVGVTVIDDTISDPIDTSDPPDLVIANVSVDYDTMYPGERFTISATVRNTGGRQASNARVRYYRSSDQVFSADDEELANTDDFIGRLEGGETSDEDAHFDAPSEQGVYYYIVRADAVRNEVNTANNYDTIKITVLPPAAPDYVVSLSRNKSLVDPGEYVRFDATVLNQGKEDSRDTTTVRFYRSLDPLPSPDDEEIATDTIRALRDGRTDDGTENGPAPTEPGTYYYYACVDGVPEERDTDNNCSNVVTVNVRGPDLVVNSVSVDYFSKTNTVRPDGIFELRATVRNQGTDDADDSTLRYYISSDATLSSDDTEVATNFVYSLDSNETSSRTYRSLHIQVPYTSGFFYALVCVDGVESESDTTNNCFEPIKITVRNFKPGTDGTIPVQALTVGTSTPLDVSGYFADANNDDLTYTARSSDPKIATVRVSGPQVTLTPQRTGNVNVTVTASDGQLTATQTFSVSVMEVETKAPDLLVESVSLDKNTVTPGETFRLNAVVKNQGDADARTVPIRYYQSTDDTISETDTQLRTGTLAVITADGMRELSVALTAPNTPGTYYYGVGVENVADESDTANNYSIGVAISVENRAPSAVGTLPPRTLSENDAPVAVDVAAYFNDPDNTALTYTAASDNPAVVMAEMRGSEMTITPVGTGNAIVTVTASDGELAATQTLSVSVVAAPTENQAPLPVDVIPVQSLTVDGASSTVDISAYFSDANGDTLTYAAWPDDKNVVGLRREGTLLTITPKAAGRATVTVRARDPDGLQALQPISVFVSTTEVPVTELPAETWMPDANLRTAVRTALGLGPNDALTQQALQSLTSLRYLGPDLSDNQKITDLTGLEHALNLEHLDLYMHLISDLRPLERLTKLRSLWLAGNKIANIRPLTNLPLEELDLGGNPITDFAPLAELTSLTRLDFWGNGLGNSNLSIITGLTQLTQLDLRNNQISDVTTLTKLVNLKKLQLKGNPISDTAPLLTLTSQNPDLDIDIEISEEPPVKPDLVDPPDLSSEVTIPDANLRALVRALLGLQIGEVITGHGMQRLTRVIADGIGIKDLTGLEYATNLKELSLKQNQIVDITPLAHLTALTKLVLDWNQIVDVTPLANLTGLTDLWIQFNQVVDITPLANLTTLTKLVLAENQIVDITPLANLMALTLLVLDRNQIVDVTPLTKLVNLERLHLKGNPISDTSPLRDLISQNPDMEIDIEISEKPPSKPDLVIESVRVNETTVALGAVFRLDAVIKNQGKAASGAATVRFYRSLDETITAEDTEVRTADLPSLAVDRTKNKWARLTAPNTAGVYYYGVCIDGVADESDTENNCSTAVKITVGTVTVEPPVVETPATTDPETGEDPSQEGSLAEQVLQKHGKTLRRPDVKEVLPDVLISLKEPDIQALLNPATINLVIKDPDLLKTMVPTISDKFIALMKTDAAIKALLSDPQVQTLLQTPAAIDELAKLLGISVAPPPTAGGVVVFRDANLAKKVREALNLPAGADIPKAQLATLMHLDASVFSTGNETQAQFEKILIKDLTGLEHATRLKTLLLVNHRVSNLSPLTDLTSLKELELSGTLTITDISPLKGLTNLVSLDLTQSRISDLSPLTHLTSLTRLSLFGTLIDDNDLTSLVPLLAGLTQLKELYLGWNQISDVTLLASFVNLRALGLSSNRVSNITPLTGLTSLTFLDLGLNQISDVSPLEGLTSLRWLRLTDNPIEDLAPLRRLKAKNPNMQIYIDLNAQAAPSAPVLPAETALFPNYPNPFNPETWIPYQLAKSADVALTIYDVRGVVVRRLALGHQTAGFYQSRARAAHWDSRNALGEKVASGLYFYTFTAGDFTATGKMLIRK